MRDVATLRRTRAHLEDQRQCLGRVTAGDVDHNAATVAAESAMGKRLHVRRCDELSRIDLVFVGNLLKTRNLFDTSSKHSSLSHAPVCERATRS